MVPVFTVAILFEERGSWNASQGTQRPLLIDPPCYEVRLKPNPAKSLQRAELAQQVLRCSARHPLEARRQNPKPSSKRSVHAAAPLPLV